MIATQGIARFGICYPATTEGIVAFLTEGSMHKDREVRRLFQLAGHHAAKAVSENADSSMIVATLLHLPCQMIATQEFSNESWTGDSLLESGTYDWLAENFGERVAETIRMQSHARRYLATVLPDYFPKLSVDEQRSVFSSGGFMDASEKRAFSNHRSFQNAMSLARWSDDSRDRWLESPAMQFFAPFIDEVLLGT